MGIGRHLGCDKAIHSSSIESLKIRWYVWAYLHTELSFERAGNSLLLSFLMFNMFENFWWFRWYWLKPVGEKDTKISQWWRGDLVGDRAFVKLRMRHVFGAEPTYHQANVSKEWPQHWELIVEQNAGRRNLIFSSPVFSQKFLPPCPGPEKCCGRNSHWQKTFLNFQ